MTKNTIRSRRACLERITILEDGTIPDVEMTSLGFDDSLSPYEITKAESACVLIGECYINERKIFTRPIVNITTGCIIGYKYFDFGDDYSSKTMDFYMKLRGRGAKGTIRILLDDYTDGKEIGTITFGEDDGNYTTIAQAVTGRHAVYFIVEDTYGGYFTDYFKGRELCEIEEFVFCK